MCTMMIPSSVCRRKPVKIVRDTTLDGLPAYIKEQLTAVLRGGVTTGGGDLV